MLISDQRVPQSAGRDQYYIRDWTTARSVSRDGSTHERQEHFIIAVQDLEMKGTARRVWYLDMNRSHAGRYLKAAPVEYGFLKIVINLTIYLLMSHECPV